jgi:hypothetical protein
MVYFQNEKHNLGKFWKALDWKMLTIFMAIRNILQTFWIFCDHFEHFLFIFGTLFSGFGNMYQVKYGNPARVAERQACCVPQRRK